LSPPETDATPFENVMVVEVPRLRAVPLLSETVGAVIGPVDEPAPPKVSALSPV